MILGDRANAGAVARDRDGIYVALPRDDRRLDSARARARALRAQNRFPSAKSRGVCRKRAGGEGAGDFFPRKNARVLRTEVRRGKTCNFKRNVFY